jgi:hypothetical protein
VRPRPVDDLPPSLFWQIAVVATILASYRFAPRLIRSAPAPIQCAKIAAIVWSIFSLWQVFFFPLLIIQLCIIWGTWLLLRNMERQA